jgi:endonuclease YncB( thermonuclease family)
MRILLTFIMAFVGATNAFAASQKLATVSSVLSGDTLQIILDGEVSTIRLEHIDAPEPGQPFSGESKAFVEKLCLGKTVTVKTGGVDETRTKLAEVITQNGRSLNTAIVAGGLAWQYKRHRYSELINSVEKSARKSRIGIWSIENPTPPWEYRDNINESQKTVVHVRHQATNSYGDSVLDIERDPDGSAIGNGGAFTITGEIKNKKQRLSNRYAPIIQARCSRKWGTDYEMVKYCVDNQTDAQNALKGMDIPPEIDAHCTSKWGSDYEMVKYCVDNQIDAKLRLGY